jgi:hypothetical protein
VIRCRYCGRVRVEVCGVEAWADHPGKMDREGEGMCPPCATELVTSRAKNWKAANQLARAERRAGKRFGETVGDAFEGFRGESK